MPDSYARPEFLFKVTLPVSAFFQGCLSQASSKRSLQCKGGWKRPSESSVAAFSLPNRKLRPKEIVSGPVPTCCPPGFREQGHRSVSLESMNSKVILIKAHIISLMMTVNATHAIGEGEYTENQETLFSIWLCCHWTSWVVYYHHPPPPSLPCFFICVVRPAGPKVPELLQVFLFVTWG